MENELSELDTQDESDETDSTIIESNEDKSDGAITDTVGEVSDEETVRGSEESEDESDVNKSDSISVEETEDESDATVVEDSEESGNDLDSTDVEVDPGLMCQICFETFDNETELFRHKTISHPECPLCDKRFIDGVSYLKHRKEDHQPDDIVDMIPDEDLGDSSDEEDVVSDNRDDDSGSEDDDPYDEMKSQDKLFKQHVNCVTVE